MKSAAKVTRLDKSTKSSEPTVTPMRMMRPPMVGVPRFVWCEAGVSSRTLLCPLCFRRKYAMSRGPTTIPATSEATSAATIRKVG